MNAPRPHSGDTKREIYKPNLAQPAADWSELGVRESQGVGEPLKNALKMRRASYSPDGSGERGGIEAYESGGTRTVAFRGERISFDDQGLHYTDRKTGQTFQASFAEINKKMPLGSVPVESTMAKLFDLAKSLRGQPTVTMGQFGDLQRVAQELRGAAQACIGVHNWGELHYLTRIAGAIEGYLSNHAITPEATERSRTGESRQTVAQSGDGLLRLASATTRYLDIGDIWATTAQAGTDLPPRREDGSIASWRKSSGAASVRKA
jgi:hypothetical protein